jgi:membrane protein
MWSPDARKLGELPGQAVGSVFEEVVGLPHLLLRSFRRWSRPETNVLAAAIAFNALLSLAPLLIVVLAVTGRILGREEARASLVEAVEKFVAADAGSLVASLIDQITAAPLGKFGPILGLGVTIYFGSNVVVQVRTALNQVWRIRHPPSWWQVISQRMTAFVVLPAAIIVALLVVVLNLAGSLVAPIADWLPGGLQLLRLMDTALSFALLTGLLAVAYRQGPRVPLRWRDVAGGALIAATLFLAANSIFIYFVKRSLLASLYGAASALILFLLWTQFTGLILLFGAHYTRTYAIEQGSLRHARGRIRQAIGARRKPAGSVSR